MILSQFREGKNDRKGLLIIGSALLIIALTLVLLVQYLQKEQHTQIRQQGLTLVRILSSIPAEELTPAPNRQGIFTLIRHSLANSPFAYITLVDKEGVPILEEATRGVVIPNAPVTSEPSSWIGERHVNLKLNQDETAVTEFFAPLLQDGELIACIRIGFFTPGIDRLIPQIPFFATLALLIFNLGCIGYFVARRNFNQLSLLSEQINKVCQNNEPLRTLKLEASGELLEFSSNFNQFMRQVQCKQLEQSQSQHELLLSNKLEAFKNSRMSSMLQTIPEAIFVLDEAGRMNFANNKLQAYLAIKQPIEEGSALTDWCPHKELIGFLNHNSGSPGGTVKHNSLIFKVPESESRIIEFSRYPLFSPKNPQQTFGILVIGRDVTEYQLALQNRGEFIAQVAHELKNPLNVLAMYSEALLGEDGNSTEFRIEASNVIHNEVNRLNQLISNLLNISKIEGSSMQVERHRVRLQDLLKDTFETISASNRDNEIKLNIIIPSEMSALHIDKDLLRIAVTNLLTNAIKYNQDGGEVTLAAEETEASVVISVEDTGIGISEEDQQLIFDKFYRSSSDEVRQKSGHGLGLSLVKEIVGLMHGKIELQSTLGIGSKFSIFFDKSTGLIQQVIK